jgi:hypothetical protein
MPAKMLRRLGLRKPQVYLHIGAMKTGTTYLQSLMDENKVALAEAGFCFPGETWQDQSRAARDVLGFSADDPRQAAEVAGKWRQVSDEMLAHRGHASVLSMEFLSFADTAQATRVLDSLSGADVHVILTVRDATTAIPTQWQTTCRNGKRVPFPRFLKGVAQVLDGADAPSGGARALLRTQWIPRMLETWVPLVGADKVHVITVPPRTADPRLLWERFAGVVGIPPAVCAEAPAEANPSLGLASTELLRRINVGITDVSRYDYERVVKRRLARQTLSTRKHLEPPIALNRRGHRLAARWNHRVRESADHHGVSVVGDLAELPVDPDLDEAPAALPQASPDQLLDAAATGRDGLLSWFRQLEVARRTEDAELALAHVELEEYRQEMGATPADRWSDGSEDPVEAAVAELCDLVREGVRIYNDVRAAIPALAAYLVPYEPDEQD